MPLIANSGERSRRPVGAILKANWNKPDDSEPFKG